MAITPIRIPVTYGIGGAPATTPVHNSATNQYQLIWMAQGNGITFGNTGASQTFWWKSGTGQPAVTVSADGKTLTSATYMNNGGGSTWSYGLTVLQNGANPVVIDPVIENEPPGHEEGDGDHDDQGEDEDKPGHGGGGHGGGGKKEED